MFFPLGVHGGVNGHEQRASLHDLARLDGHLHKARDRVDRNVSGRTIVEALVTGMQRELGDPA